MCEQCEGQADMCEFAAEGHVVSRKSDVVLVHTLRRLELVELYQFRNVNN